MSCHAGILMVWRRLSQPQGAGSIAAAVERFGRRDFPGQVAPGNRRLHTTRRWHTFLDGRIVSRVRRRQRYFEADTGIFHGLFWMNMSADKCLPNVGHAENVESAAAGQIPGHSRQNRSDAGSGIPNTGEGLVAAIFVIGLVLWVYSPVLTCGFVTYDDPLYVTKNPRVQAGLSWDGLIWAFTSLFYFYHPLTWVSLMLDVKLFGIRAAGFHFTNLLLHTTNVCLLLWFLVKNTGKVLPKHFCVALFIRPSSHQRGKRRLGFRAQGFAGQLRFSGRCVRFIQAMRAKPSLLRYVGGSIFLLPQPDGQIHVP